MVDGGEASTLWLKGQGNEGFKSACEILQIPESGEVVYNIRVFFQMAKEHGGIAGESELVGLTVNRQPVVCGNLFGADLISNGAAEDLCPAAGYRAEAGVMQATQNHRYRQLGTLGQRLDFHGSQALDEYSRQDITGHPE